MKKTIKPTALLADGRALPTLLTGLLMAAGISNTQAIPNNQKKEFMSTIQRNEAIVRSVYEQSLNKRNFDLLHELISAEYPGFQGIRGPEGFEKPIDGLIQAFPDIQWNIEDLVGEEDKVAVRWQWQGTHKGVFSGYAPTGKTLTNDGMAIFLLKDGKIVSGVLQTDRLGFLQSIDVVPANIGFARPAQVSSGEPAQEGEHKAEQQQQGKISLIDKFVVPPASKPEFYARMHVNRNFLKNLPGLIRQDAYEYTDHDGNLICVTVAEWESKEAIDKAKEAVQAEYKREGFDMPGMLKRLNITIDRGIYTDVHEE
jgi:predicted ester cyclase